MEAGQRLYWIDSLRVIAIVAVILLHVAAPAVVLEFSHNSDQNATWWTANFYNSLSRFCVPLFVMITGALLLSQQITLKAFLSKRLQRILIPFLFWSSLYLLFFLGLKFRDEGIKNWENIAVWIGNKLLLGTAVHLWYVYMLIGLYLIIPILSPWIRQASNRAIQYFLIIWLFSLILSAVNISENDTPLDISYFSGYVGYLILGYYLAYRLKLNSNLIWISIGLITTGFLITLVGTYIVSSANQKFTDVFYNYLSTNVLFYTTGIFILARALQTNPGSNSMNFRIFMSKYGFGIYLNHLLILSILSFLHLDYNVSYPIVSIPFIALSCLVISSAISHLLYKMPYGRYIAG